MAIVVNKSAAKISARLKDQMFDFVPGILTRVESDEMKELKKIPLISRSLDNGDLVTGKDAKAIASDAEKELKAREQQDADDNKD